MQDEEDQLKIEANTAVTDAKSHWIDLFNGFAEMADLVASDLAFFLYCMLNSNLKLKFTSHCKRFEEKANGYWL